MPRKQSTPNAPKQVQKSVTKQPTAKQKRANNNAQAEQPVLRTDGNSEDFTNIYCIAGGVICILLGLITFVGFFSSDAIATAFLCKVFKGLFGYGYFVLPLAFFYTSFLLIFRKRSPLKLRVFCTGSVPALVGIFVHLIGSRVELSNSKFGENITTLYHTGNEATSGGVISGLIAAGSKKLVSLWVAIPFFIILLVVCVCVAIWWNPFYRRWSKKHITSQNNPGRAGQTPYRQSNSETVQQNETEVWEQQQNAPERGQHHRKDFSQAETVFDDLAQPQNAPYTQSTPPAAENNYGYRFCGSGEAYSQNSRGAKTNFDVPWTGPKEKNAGECSKATGKNANNGGQEQRRGSAPSDNSKGNSGVTAGTRSSARPSARSSTESVKPMTYEEAVRFTGIKPIEVEPPEEEKTVSSKPTARKAEIAEQEQPKTTFVPPEEKNPESTQEYCPPSTKLLKKGSAVRANLASDANENRRLLQEALNNYKVSAEIVDFICGPSVTQYELRLEPGVKLAKVIGISSEIALALGVTGVRIAQIPKKRYTVGVEVPNSTVSTVYLRDMLESEAFQTAKSKLTFAIGRDIYGNCICGDISKLPHLLIAGTTGSGKSVCMNTLILSILYKASPDEVRFIMIDPKMVEMGVYNGIPHLYVPVVTDAKKAAGALQWAVVEMMKRYTLFRDAGARDLSTYNSILLNEGEATLPRIVIVVDELSDLMMVASKEVEESICRVAQMGRAAGIHLVMATQRPSADVITGLMKANIPSRIALSVSSAMESRIILDAQGAEKLIGNGDMLYAPIGGGEPRRIQGAFASDDERDAVIQFLKANSEPEYREDVMAQIEKAAADTKRKGPVDSDEEESVESNFDELLPQAADVIFDTKQASVSMLQRRLKLGYARAARIMDQLEEVGVVGASEGAKPRQILISREQWMEMQMITGAAPTERFPEQNFDSGEFSDTSDGEFEELPWKTT